MVSSKFFRKAGWALLTLVGLLLLYVGFIAGQAYVTTPNILHDIESSGALRLKLKDVPRDFLTALLAVEDPNFYQHSGVDLATNGAGWTTITQALVKIYFYRDFSPGFLRHRKLNQTIIALAFNARTDKQTQLRLFLNAAYFGQSSGKEIIGFSAAAQEFFGKEFVALSQDEFLSLTAMLIAPNEYNPRTQPAKNAERVRRIKRLLNGECAPASRDDVSYENC